MIAFTKRGCSFILRRRRRANKKGVVINYIGISLTIPGKAARDAGIDPFREHDIAFLSLFPGHLQLNIIRSDVNAR